MYHCNSGRFFVCVLEVDILAKQGLVHPLRHKTHDASWPQLLLMVRRSGRSTSTWSCGLLCPSLYQTNYKTYYETLLAQVRPDALTVSVYNRPNLLRTQVSIPITHGLVERRWASRIPLKLRHSFFPFPVGSWPLLGITALLLIPYRNTIKKCIFNSLNEWVLFMFSDYIFVRVNSLFIIELFWITFSLSLVKRRSWRVIEI